MQPVAEHAYLEVAEDDRVKDEELVEARSAREQVAVLDEAGDGLVAELEAAPHVRLHEKGDLVAAEGRILARQRRRDRIDRGRRSGRRRHHLARTRLARHILVEQHELFTHIYI